MTVNVHAGEQVHASLLSVGVGTAPFKCESDAQLTAIPEDAEVVLVQLGPPSDESEFKHVNPTPTAPPTRNLKKIPAASPNAVTVVPEQSTSSMLHAAPLVRYPPVTYESFLTISPYAISSLDFPEIHLHLFPEPIHRSSYHLTQTVVSILTIELSEHVVSIPSHPTDVRFVNEALKLNIAYSYQRNPVCVYKNLLTQKPPWQIKDKQFKRQSDILIRASANPAVAYLYDPRWDGQHCAQNGDRHNVGPVDPGQINGSPDGCPLRLTSEKALRLVAYTWDRPPLPPPPSKPQGNKKLAKSVAKRLGQVRGDSCPRRNGKDTILCIAWAAIKDSVPSSVESLLKVHSQAKIRVNTTDACAEQARIFQNEFKSHVEALTALPKTRRKLIDYGELFALSLESGCFLDFDARDHRSLEKNHLAALRLARWALIIRNNRSADYFNWPKDILNSERDASALADKLLPVDPRVKAIYFLPFQEVSDTSDIEFTNSPTPMYSGKAQQASEALDKTWCEKYKPIKGTNGSRCKRTHN